MASNIDYRNDWDDDDRHPVVRSVRSMRRSSSPDVSLGHVCREIACDYETRKRRVLWNEVEFVNYTYEFSNQDDLFNSQDIEQNGVDGQSLAHKSATELNPECFDNLVKNQTAYL